MPKDPAKINNNIQEGRPSSTSDQIPGRNMFELENKDTFPLVFNLYGTSAQTAGNYTHFYTARNPIDIIWVSVVYAVTNGAACTLDIEKLTGTTAPGLGTTVLASTFDLNTTANTVAMKEGSNLKINSITGRTLKTGDRLGALIKTGALNAIVSLQVSIHFKYSGRGHYR
jgi:hypothetical protein